MKLYEEFKLYEDMWEDEVPATEEFPVDEEPVEPVNPLIRTFGRKTYNLANPDELDAWFKANFEFQQKRYPTRYRDAEGAKAHWYRLRATIAKNLLTSLEAEGVSDPAIISYLQNKIKVSGGLSKVFTLDEISNMFAALTAGITTREAKAITPELESIKQKLIDMRNI